LAYGLRAVQALHPPRELVVPHEGVPLDLHAVALREGRDLIARGEVEPPRRGLVVGPLHLVLGGHVVELARRRGVRRFAEPIRRQGHTDDATRTRARVGEALRWLASDEIGRASCRES